MANRFRVFLTSMQLSAENAEKVTLVSCVLHNFLREKSSSRYTPPVSFDAENIDTGEFQEGHWRLDGTSGLQSVEVTGSNNHNFQAKEIRDNFCNYFNNNFGSVSWQNKFI